MPVKPAIGGLFPFQVSSCWIFASRRLPKDSLFAVRPGRGLPVLCSAVLRRSRRPPHIGRPRHRQRRAAPGRREVPAGRHLRHPSRPAPRAAAGHPRPTPAGRRSLEQEDPRHLIRLCMQSDLLLERGLRGQYGRRRYVRKQWPGSRQKNPAQPDNHLARSVEVANVRSGIVGNVA